MTKSIQLPAIKPEEQTPLVRSLVEIIERLAETVQPKNRSCPLC